ncbi:arginine N-succinyltransferase [Guyparkeria halophila]|uniref:Arginine N-succinyltransferase n=1 Tax=Guyparkeria halophila TaxID=47960 RepID=A0A6I6CU41_9GAMM|nr:arginine N-succinyltransferase [Guyparkeria halophila]QGT77499.1 arginine N-succinyltransferase [Guyparkeria halophila]
MNQPPRTPDDDQGASPAHVPEPKRGVGCLGVSLIVVGTMVVTLALGAVAVRYFLFPSPFEPVELDTAEQQRLDDKLAAIGVQTQRTPPPAGDRFAARPEEFDAQGRLKPEAYREQDAPREVQFDERELNAIIARDPAMARRLAIDLSEDLVSVKLLVPLPPDFPIMGGQTLRLNAGAEVRQVPTPNGSRLAVVVTGVSLWGVPLPNAWIGGLKGVDLVAEFGGQPGFWQSLADGVESVQVEEGQLVFRLAE